MSVESLYLFTADALLVIHALFVAFVVFGAVAIYLSLLFSWEWVRNYWFRIVHLAGIAFVLLESWAGIPCPLTVWEIQLRESAGVVTYSGSFVQHWLQTLLYYEAPKWVFTVFYTVFGALVFLSWFIVRPKRRH